MTPAKKTWRRKISQESSFVARSKKARSFRERNVPFLHKYNYMFLYIYKYIHVYIHMYIYMYIYVYVYTYICKYIYTYTNI